MHNFLSTYYLYVYKLSKGLLFLECLKIVVGIKVTDRSFQTILDILNNLAELILYAPNNNTKIRDYCVSSFSDNESLSPFCLNDLKYIYIYIIYIIIYNIYICIYIYTYIYIHVQHKT